MLKTSKRSGSVICLIVMLIFGCFSITATCLLVRSEKKTEMEEALTLTGDYDVIAYDTPIGFEDNLARSEVIDDVGVYYELGTVTNSDERETFKAVALKDELSEEMYHLTCMRGFYPKNDNEVAIDVSVANTYGIAPYPGETISLKSFDNEGTFIKEEEYVISGVFRLSNEAVYGGWNRAPLIQDMPLGYQMPAVFFCSSDFESWNCTKETVFIKSYSASGLQIEDEVRTSKRIASLSQTGIEYNQRRSAVYSWYIGLDNDTFYGQSLETRYEAVTDGLYQKDFYSEIVFPIISIMVILTEAMTIYMLSKNIISDRREHYAILRSIGMSSKRIIGNLLAEMLALGVLGVTIGITLGYVSHIAFIRLLNFIWHLQLYDGIHVEKVIKQITYDPIVTSILVCVCSLGIALSIPLYRLYKTYPSELLAISDSMFVGKKKKSKQKTTNLKEKWLGLLNKRIDLHDVSTMLVMIIVLSCALLGYVFFRAFSEQATVEERGYQSVMGFEGNGYVVSRNSDLQNLGDNVYNRHDAGIVPSFPEQIEEYSDVERVWSVIKNESTRMVFSEEPNERVKQLLGNRSLNRRSSDDPYQNEGYVAETSIFKHMGYDTPVYMYELPTVGLTMKEMKELDGELIAGSIDVDRIKSGNEIVLAVPEELRELCLQYYPIGSSLEFDDILLTEEEEKLDNQSRLEEKWIVYDNYIETDMGEYHICYTSFGSRYSVKTEVGAIVVLHDEKDKAEYLSSGTEWVNQLHYYTDSDANDPEPTYGMSVLCLPESFKNWGLPDRYFTSVKAELKDDYDAFEFDELWYRSLAGSVEVQTKSTFDYTDTIKIKTNRVMIIFLVLIAILVVLGMVSIIAGLYTKTRSNLARFQTLRRVGLSVRQVSVMIYTQNVFYPLMAAIISIVPVCVVQWFLNSYRVKIEKGVFDLTEKPWYVRIPYWADLFSYNFIPALICCLLLGFLLIFIGTLPQILYLRRMKMIETREE